MDQLEADIQENIRRMRTRLLYKAVSPDQILMVSDTLNAFLFAACMKEKHFTPSCFEIVIHTKVIPDEDSAFLSSIAQDLVTLQIHSSVLSRNPLDIFLKRCRVSHHKPGTSAFYRTSCATLTLVRGLVTFCSKVGTLIEKRKTEYENERKTMEPLDSLVRSVQKGNAEVFNHIVERFQDMAWAGAYAMVGDVHLAEDVAQEAFLEAYLNLAKLREPAAFGSWFRHIILKQADRLTRGKSLASSPLEGVADLPVESHGPAEIAETNEARAAGTRRNLLLTRTRASGCCALLWYGLFPQRHRGISGNTHHYRQKAAL